MMSTALPLLLHAEQAERLLRYMQAYRQYALIHLPPTQERNTTLRLVQALQGKLLALSDQIALPVQLAITREERVALQAMTKSLLQLYGKKPDSSDRAMTILDVGSLYTYLKQTDR